MREENSEMNRGKDDDGGRYIVRKVIDDEAIVRRMQRASNVE